MVFERVWMADSIDLEQPEWVDVLSPFSLQLEHKEQSRYQLLDTFDWALWQQGRALLYNHSGGKKRAYELWNRNEFLSGSAFTQQASGRKRGRFWWDISAQQPVTEPQNEFEQLLKKACKLRVLLEMHHFEQFSVRYAVKNSDLKSVAWIELVTLRHSSGERTLAEEEGAPVVRQVLRVLPVRGYDLELKKLQKRVQKMGLPLYTDHLLEEYLLASGVTPARYQSKPSIVINTEDVARDVVLRYLRALLNVSRENEHGIVEDLDIEFLHDYRVSLRRIRSILSLVRKVFSPEETRWLKQQFAAIAKRTNQLRDLDVYLLEQENYRALVPPVLAEGVDTLFASLVLEPTRELRRVRRWLRSADYDSTMKAIQLRLEGEAEKLGAGLQADKAVLSVATKEISKKFHKIGKLGMAIDASTPDQEVHDLRIECKKLRYLLDFFGNLFPKKMQRSAVSTLKRLQDNLGKFNDLSVQQESLQAFLLNHQQDQVSMLAAVGGLIGALNLEQKQERAKVTETFSEFYSAQTRQLYAEMVREKEDVQ